VGEFKKMEVNAQMVKELRSRTGAGIMDCKEALKEKDGVLDEAIKFLREKGLSNAAKKAGREVSDGQIYACINATGTTGAIIEVNCETDFVARTEEFQSVLDTISKHVVETEGSSITITEADDFLEEVVKAAIAKLGENIQFGRADKLSLGDEKVGLLASYIHPGAKIGVLLELCCESVDVKDSDEFKEIAHDLCMHIAATNPNYLSQEDIPDSIISAEKEILFAQLAEEDKPQEILEKIVEGRIKKFKKEICLLDQPFVKDTDIDIDTFISNKSEALKEKISLSSFRCYILGDSQIDNSNT
tara:strand:- start:8802 stop:9707 length:906 start_codon:yes stop_codon:yes gene_type:complete